MTEQLQSIWYNFILNVKGNFNPIVDLLDILVVTFLIYEAISLVRQTRTAQLAKGIIAVLLAYAVANLLGMRTLAWLINSIMSFGIIALVVVFQPELRRALEQVGRTSLFGMQLFKSKADPGDLRAKWQSAIVAVCDSAEQLADSRTGALVVLERRTNLSEIIKTGTVLNADITPEMLGTIFYEGTPLHDGAVVVRDGRIEAAGCFLPLSNNLEIGKDMGTRHRAALGMSENSDAVVVVVSEETGIISRAKTACSSAGWTGRICSTCWRVTWSRRPSKRKNARSGGESMKNNTNNAPSNASSQAKPMGRFEKLFSNRWFAMAVSAMLAVLLWLVVIAQEPNKTYTITGVSVSYDYNSALYTGASLDIVKSDDIKVSVVVSGDSSAIGGVDKSDIVVYPDYTEVSRSGMPGEYTLRLQARRADTSLTKFDIDSISPAYVDVTFAQIGTQKFTVEVEASVDPAEGYYLGEKQASPAEVTLRGPVDELARVARVVARVESDEKRDRTMLDSAALEFLDADGHAITDSSITVLEGEQVEVTIPVLKLKEVPLKFEFSNVPAGYDPAELNASISPATIRIAGAADTVDGIESVNAGFINLARVQLGKAETLKIQLSEGLVNVDDVQEATVTFDTSGYGEPRAITVSDIRVVNAPSGVDVKVITESINNVTLVGEAEELAAISPSDVIAQVDASAQNITVKGSGQQQFSAQIIVTGTKTVFATGAYSVLCDITVK